MISIDDIKKVFRGRIRLNEPMDKHTYIRIGGPADYFFEPADRDDSVWIFSYLQMHDIRFAAIGRGSNLLVSDEGFRGVIVAIESGLKSMHSENMRVYAEAGVSLLRLVEYCTGRGMKGVEKLAGIPGTVGGAIIMNAGAFGSVISDHLNDVEIVRNGALLLLKKEQILFGYRRTSLHQNDVVLSASFELPWGDKEEIINMRNELILKRNRSQPTNLPNSGCMFKNPEGAPAAKLIEEAGLKGIRSGNAQVSGKHANFIVNLGGATAKDVLALLETVRREVFEKYNIALEPEVKFLGFSHDAFKEIKV